MSDFSEFRKTRPKNPETKLPRPEFETRDQFRVSSNRHKSLEINLLLPISLRTGMGKFRC